MSKSEFILGVILSGVGTYIAAAVVLSRRPDGGHASWGALIAATQRRAQLWRCGKLI